MAASTEARPFDVVSFIMDYEAGELDEDATIEGFQHLIDSGTVWSLQGSYGRTAAALIEAGYCTDSRPAKPARELHLYRVFFATPDEQIFSSQVQSPEPIGGQYDPVRAQVVLAAWRKIRERHDLTTAKLLGIDKL